MSEKSESVGRAQALQEREKIVGRLSGGSGLMPDDVADFCRVLHADVAIEYHEGIVHVFAIRTEAM